MKSGLRVVDSDLPVVENGAVGPGVGRDGKKRILRDNCRRLHGFVVGG